MPVTRYSASQGRRFALTVAGAFAVLAAISFWRGRLIVPGVLGGMAIALLLAGLIVPSRLEPIERAWMSLGHALSKVTTPVFMAIVYFLVLTPVGLLRRLLGKNALVRVARGDSYWIARTRADRETARRRMERQF